MDIFILTMLTIAITTAVVAPLSHAIGYGKGFKRWQVDTFDKKIRRTHADMGPQTDEELSVGHSLSMEDFLRDSDDPRTLKSLIEAHNKRMGL